MILFDTDIVVLLQGGDTAARRRTIARMRRADGVQLRISVVAYEEQLRGWTAVLAAAGQDQQRLIHAYGKLCSLHWAYRHEALLPYDERAAAEFRRFRQSRVRIGTMDLRIASIASAHAAKLVTRNLKDFRQVPGLIAEDWTSESDSNGFPPPPDQ